MSLPGFNFSILTRLILLGVLFALPSMNVSADAFVRFGSLKGDATEAAHPDWSRFDASSLFLYRIPGSAGLQLTRLQLSKPADSTTPSLSVACAKGEVFPLVKLDFTRSTDSGVVIYFQLTLEQVTIISHSTSGAPTSLSEVMDLDFKKISWLYTIPRTATKPGSSVGAFWDTIRNLGGDFSSEAFQVYGLTVQAGAMQLAWPAQQGQRFRVLGSEKVEGPYRVLQEITAQQTGGLEVSLPGAGAAFFFNVERLP